MALGFGQTKDEDVTTLIARKQYAKAIEIIRAQLQAGRPDPRLRMQLADALVLAGREREGVMILLSLADEFAKDGFAAKAIAVLKKIQKLDPGRRDIEAKLASLIENKQREASVSLGGGPAPGGLEIGIEEIGFEVPGGSMAVPAGPSAPAPWGIETPEVALGSTAPLPRGSSPAPGSWPAPAPVEDHDLMIEDESVERPSPRATTSSAITIDQDDLVLEGMEPLIEAEPNLDLEPLQAEPALDATPATPRAAVDAKFADELLSVIDDLFPSAMASDFTPGTSPGGGAPAAGREIVVSPLFKDFSVDEMVAVIQGLRLLTYAARKIILRQGDPGDSLYMLTSGRVRAFVKSADGRQVPLADLEEGAFFGEMSILTGKPRSATVVAVSDCELLELDRVRLDLIVASHPRVLDVLKEFARARSRGR
jgi:hypothetical protein